MVVCCVCVCSECVLRWGVLWKPLRVKFARQTPLLAALMILHNFCINERLERIGTGIGMGVGEEGPATFAASEHVSMQNEKETRSAAINERAAKFPDLNENRAPADMLTGDELPTATRKLIGDELATYERASRLRNEQAQLIEQKGWKRPPLVPKHSR